MRFAHASSNYIDLGMDAASGIVVSMLISVIDARPEGLLDQGTKIIRYHCKHANMIHICETEWHGCAG